jgi:hypothetical protein
MTKNKAAQRPPLAGVAQMHDKNEKAGKSKRARDSDASRTPYCLPTSLSKYGRLWAQARIHLIFLRYLHYVLGIC